MWIEIVAIGLLIGLDQLVKYLTVIHLQGNSPYVIIDGVFQLTYVENSGAAFGMLQNQRTFFLIFTLIVIGLVLVYYLKIPKTKRFTILRITVILFFAGALGNWIDRLRLSYVIDTFYFNLINFPVFNVADSYVVVSTFVFAYLILFYYKENEFDFIKSKAKKE
ncbi:MAG: signal peptidase II [Firmicutes bacterium HGW-Firmicutes-7]|nr:MAG: signal peptidase II [Firmicutes bacterium HGW-Firmicutes-7]